MTDEENQSIEYKHKWSDDCLKVISAMSNTNGGRLYIGLNNKGYPIGLNNTKKMLEDIPNTIRNRLSILSRVEREKRGEHNIICIAISRSSIPVSFNGKYCIRTRSTVQELGEKELSDFLLSKSGIL